ncbi:MAG: mannose-1-phosphate guanylyltransferase [Candidatus Sericytochromatia bacterium]
MSLHAVILAGGVGARFWPRSRQNCPKQYLSVFSEYSLIQETVRRLREGLPLAAIWVITRHDQREVLQEQLPDLHADQLICEPAGRSTAPCIALAAKAIAERDPEALMLVLPADHLIQDQPLFVDTLQRAVDYLSEDDLLMTVGIQPNRPETGYGYLLFGRQALSEGIHRVKQFVEKPDLETARRYVRSERYLWNAGMFLWRVRTIQAEIRQHLPRLASAFDALPRTDDADFESALAATYAELPVCSIDHGVLEKSERVGVIKGHFGWSDVGSWESVYALSPQDDDGNVLRGQVYTLDTQDSYIYSPQRFTAVIGLRDLVVVETPDALLICDRKRSQDVRHVVHHLTQSKHEELC